MTSIDLPPRSTAIPLADKLFVAGCVAVFLALMAGVAVALQATSF
jgi:hypothetical protein